MELSAKQNSVLSNSDRAWPLPSRKPAMRMNWHDLLFMHWPVAANSLASLIPDGLDIDEYDSTAWISVVPFTMSSVAPRWLPDVPWVSKFPELNVRTYVSCNGKPGVWFYTLDADNPIAVRIARALFHLNYVDANIQVAKQDNWIQYRSERTDRKSVEAELNVEYRPVGDVRRAKKGSLEDWLTSRYCLYAANRSGQLFRGEIDHKPWRIRDAQAIVHKNTMLESLGIETQVNDPVLLQFAERTDVVAWRLESI